MNKNLIVIDIQPEYSKYIPEWLWKATCDKVNSASNVCWYYVDFNCEYVYFDNQNSEEYWMLIDKISQYLPESKLEEIQFIPKTYGFLRNQMDHGIADDLIIKQLKLMMQMNVNDSRDIWDRYSSESSSIKRKITMLRNQEELIERCELFVPSFDTDILYDFRNAEMIGGGRDQCLAEMSLYMKALDIPHHINEQLTY